jgi:hypothetical protein
MPPVRRRAKAVLLVDAEDIVRLDVGMSPNTEAHDGAAWRRIWAKRWPAEGARLMAELPDYAFGWAIREFGDPHRRRQAPRTPEEETK